LPNHTYTYQYIYTILYNAHFFKGNYHLNLSPKEALKLQEEWERTKRPSSKFRLGTIVIGSKKIPASGILFKTNCVLGVIIRVNGSE
jgi:hypothetical protein